MANKDINLFKAAGGERAKATKRSPVTIMLIIGIIIVIAAIGVAVYFNMKVNNAKNEYLKKESLRSSYENTISYVADTSAEFLKVTSDLEAAAAINAYIARESALYPEATETEIKAVKSTIVEEFAFSVNDPEEDEPFVAIDYEGLRASLYDEGVEIEKKELFYYALQGLAQKQKKTPKENVWYSYYRGYFVMVFIGDADRQGLLNICERLISSTGTMEGVAPFSRLTMVNDDFSDKTMYTPAEVLSKEYSDTLYNVIMIPMKSVVERVFDILEAHSRALIEENGWQGQEDLAKYGVDNFVFENTGLKFSLILPEKTSLPLYMSDFDASVFFTVSPSVLRSEGEPVAHGVSYMIELEYAFRPTEESEAE